MPSIHKKTPQKNKKREICQCDNFCTDPADIIFLHVSVQIHKLTYTYVRPVSEVKYANFGNSPKKKNFPYTVYIDVCTVCHSQVL